MKNTKKIVAIALVLVMLVAFAACNKMPNITKAFEKEGYEVTSDTSLLSSVINAAAKSYYEDQEKEVAFVAWTVSKGLTKWALVLEFKNQKELKDFYDNSSNTVQGIIKDFQESDIVNGNCLILTYSQEMVDVFKAA